jgi:hypothetical protein
VDRLLANTAGTVTLKVYDGNGDLVDLSAPPTVTVKDGAAATLGSGTATRLSLGFYSFNVTPTMTALLDEIDIVWTGTLAGTPVTFTTRAVVASEHPITLAELRGSYKDLVNETKYPDSAVIEARDTATERLERAMKVALVPRGRRVSLDGDDTSLLILPDRAVTSVYSVKQSGVAVGFGYSVVEWGAIQASAGGGYFAKPTAAGEQYAVHYVHGWEEPPLPVRRALRLLAVEMLVPSSLPARASSLATDAGQFRLTIAGRDGYTGLPEVDAVIDQFGMATPAVG